MRISRWHFFFKPRVVSKSFFLKTHFRNFNVERRSYSLNPPFSALRMRNNLNSVKLYVLKWIWFGSNSFGHIRIKPRMIRKCSKSINWLLLLISFPCHFMDGEIRNLIRRIFTVSIEDQLNKIFVGFISKSTISYDGAYHIMDHITWWTISY